MPAHCPLSRVFAYNVRLCLLFGLISTAEFRDSSSSERERAREGERERERGRVSKIRASRGEDGAAADSVCV